MRTTVEKIYDTFLTNKSKTHKKENNYYRPSSAGMCSRKLYYESIEKAEATNPPNPRTFRIFRIGELVHRDIQKAFKKEKTTK